MTDDLDRCVTASEAARLLGLRISTIRRLTWAREIPFIRVTGRRAVRYRLRDLEALLRMRSQPVRGERLR